MPTEPARVLVVEDEETLRRAIGQALVQAGFVVDTAPDGENFAERIARFRPDATVLDIMLPGENGLHLAQRLWAAGNTPVLFVTARDAVDDRLAAFQAGADDYIMKPFVLAELAARVTAVLRRTGRLVSPTMQVRASSTPCGGSATASPPDRHRYQRMPSARRARGIRFPSTKVRPMRTTSLRLRVVAAVLAMLTIVLVAVGILINLVLGGQLRADLQQRLIDRAGYAQILAEQGLEAQSLANRLTGDDVTVTYSVGGDTVYGRADPTPGADRGPGMPPHAESVPGAVVTQSGDRLSVTQTVAGGTLTLSSSEAGIDAVLVQLRTIEVVAGLLTIVVTWLLLTGVVGVALRPLTRMTSRTSCAPPPPVYRPARRPCCVTTRLAPSGKASRLAQVATNLLGNARNATEVGGSIRTDLAVVDGAVQLTVSDSGAGVPEADRERIFERFVRLDPSRASNRGGSGLGLSIARALARAHGGTLECLGPIATPGALAGARFALTLPRAD
ncbi:response regulator [Cryobacterium sp. N19]|nr:response regulator [Cryobacterium sp. N19]